MELIPQLILLLLVIYTAILLGRTTIGGAPYAPLGKEKIDTMINLLDIKKGDKVVDLGSGDGRIVIGLARKGAQAHGYEINPLLVVISKYKINKAGLGKNAFIHMKSYWNEDVSKFDAITLFGAPHIMKKLKGKFEKELKPGTKIVSNYFKFPDWNFIKEKDKIYFYII